MTLGALALTTDKVSREGGSVPLTNVTHIPYDGTPGLDSISYLRWILEDDHSGTDKPAAIVLETIQAEGGINVAGTEWLREVRKICDEYAEKDRRVRVIHQENRGLSAARNAGLDIMTG